MYQTASSSTAWLHAFHWQWKPSKVTFLVPPKAENDNSPCNPSPLQKHSQRLFWQTKDLLQCSHRQWDVGPKPSGAAQHCLFLWQQWCKTSNPSLEIRTFSSPVGLWPQPNATLITPNDDHCTPFESSSLLRKFRTEPGFSHSLVSPLARAVQHLAEMMKKKTFSLNIVNTLITINPSLNEIFNFDFPNFGFIWGLYIQGERISIFQQQNMMFSNVLFQLENDRMENPQLSLLITHHG